MSIEGMVEAWGEYGSRAREFYGERTAARLRSGEPLEEGQFTELDALADGMLEASERLRAQAEDELVEAGAERYGRAPELLLAAAAVDAMLARDLAALDPSIVYSRFEDPLDEGTSPAGVYREGQLLLEQVDALFRGLPGPLLGAQEIGREALIAEAQGAVRRLVGSAEEPARDLLKGLLSSAAGGALEFLATTGLPAELDEVANRLAKKAPRFVREHVLKIGLLRPNDEVVDEVADQVGDRMSVRVLLEGVAGVGKANVRVAQRIAGATAIAPEDEGRMRSALAALGGDFRRQADLLGKSARWLRRGAKPLHHLATLALGPAGLAVVPGVFLVGLGYVGYALTDRIDARDLGPFDLVVGVVRIVEDTVPPF